MEMQGETVSIRFFRMFFSGLPVGAQILKWIPDVPDRNANG